MKQIHFFTEQYNNNNTTLFKQPVYGFFLLFLFLNIEGFAQDQSIGYCGTLPNHKATSTNPDSIFSDRFGNTYDIKDFNPPEANSTCVVGYFNLCFSENFPEELMFTICQVFEDLADVSDGEGVFQRPPSGNTCAGPPQLVNINVGELVAAPTQLAGASPTYPFSTIACNEVEHSNVYRKINGVETTNIFGSDGLLLVNFNPSHPWYLGNGTPPPMSFDLYSVIQHEALHILGFASLMEFSGEPLEGHFSLWDQYLYTVPEYNNPFGTASQVIESDCSSNCWKLNETFGQENALLNAALGNCTSSENLDFVFGENAIAPIAGGMAIPPPPPTAYTIGDLRNMMSHLHNTCNNTNEDYLMHPFFFPGSSSQKDISDAEWDILCELGYKTADCNGCYVISNGDNRSFLQEAFQCCSKEHYGCVDKTVTVLFDDLMCNDFFNGNIQVADFGLSPLSSVAATVGIDGESFSVTATTPGVATMFYTILDESCDCKASTSYFSVYFDPCVSCDNVDPCENLTCIGDFEAFEPGYGNVITDGINYVYDEGLPNNSVDICDFQGNKYIHIIGAEGASHESFALKLEKPILPGCSLHLTFEASVNVGTNVPNLTDLEIHGSSTKPCHPSETLINPNCPGTTSSPTCNYEPVCLFEVDITNLSTGIGNCIVDGFVPNLQHYNNLPTWTNTTGETINYLIFKNECVAAEGFKSVHIDDIVITRSCTDLDPNFSFELDCADFPVQFTSSDDNSDFSHSWDFGDGNMSSLANPTHTYSNGGSYIVTHTITDECGNSESTSMPLDLENCVAPCECENGVNIDAVNGSDDIEDYPVNFSTSCISIRGTLNITEPFTVLIGTEVFMHSGAQINIENGAELLLSGTDIHGCEEMWRGITVEAGGTLIMDDNRIADAQYAVRPFHGASIFIARVDFDRNYVGIHVAPLAGSSANQTISEAEIVENRFRCTENLLPPFEGQKPDPGSLTFAGVYLYRSLGLNLKPEADEPNTFEGIRNGMVITNSVFEVEYADVLSTVGAGSFNLDNVETLSGNGLIADRSNINQRNCTFNNSYIGSWARFSNTEIINNLYGNESVDEYNIVIGIGIEQANFRNTIIEQDTINASQFGIGITQTSPVVLIVEENLVNIDPLGNSITGQGIHLGSVQELNFPSLPPIRVENNTVNTFSSAFGINVNSCRGVQFVNNNVFENGLSGQIGYFNVWNSDHCFFYDNNVFGDAGEELDGIGMNVNNSFKNIYCCNSLTDVRVGINFTGTCFSSGLLGTTFAGSQETGLHISDGTIIGAQNRTGNRWTGSYSSNFGAIHSGQVEEDVEDSQFVVNANAQNIDDLFPSFMAITNNWFIQEFGGNDNMDCKAQPDCGIALPTTPKITKGDLAIAKGLSNSFSPATQWHSRRFLLNKLEETPLLQQDDPLVQAFYNDGIGEAAQMFNEVEKEVNALHNIDYSDAEALSDLYQSADDLLLQIQLLESLIDISDSGDSILLMEEKLMLLNELNDNLETTLDLWNDLELSVQAKANSLKAVNNLLNEATIYEKNEVSVNRILLDKLTEGLALNNQQISILKEIAEQCPLEGGNAVFKARGLLRFISNALYDDTVFCSNEVEKEGMEQANRGQKEIQIYPIPAKNKLTVNLNYKEDGDYQLSVHDLLGTILLIQPLDDIINIIDVSELIGGLYILEISRDGESVYTEKIVIE